MGTYCSHATRHRQRNFGTARAFQSGMARTFDPVTLRLFIAVCEERNLARAAEREAIVASAVSKRIAAIEAEVGAPLLVRGRRGIEPTAAGQALLRQAREALGAMERMHAELSDFATGVQSSAGVAAAPSVQPSNKSMSAVRVVRSSLCESVQTGARCVFYLAG